MPLIMHSPKLQRLGTVDHSSSSRLRVYQVWKGKNIIVLLFLTSGSDPGIIPRNSQPPDPDDDSSGVSADWSRNYRYFFMFVSSTTLLCLHVLFSCSLNIRTVMNKHQCTPCMAVQQSPIAGMLIGYTFVICWFVGGLTMFHLYIISTNQTTYENFRYQYDRKMNPYNVGTFRNRMEVFCSRKPRSRNDFRALVRNDSLVNSYTGATSDLELGRRRGFDAGDFEDPRNRMGHLGRLERCRTQPRHDHWEERRGNWR
ncbi:probable protein S-acyltransferase 7 [Salvia splendens]|uniref:probable protein S-acyltransferase 7 n=1 Tax=Salvia splendens TaxID=180675 RepID=UPI001C26F0D4|nr:probable protein S-acyltransferase 7 [Salvia splendens]